MDEGQNSPKTEIPTRRTRRSGGQVVEIERSDENSKWID